MALTNDQLTAVVNGAIQAVYPGITAANAETIYNLWGSATTELHATFLTQLLGRCG